MSQFAETKHKAADAMRTVAVRAADVAYQQGRELYRAAKGRSRLFKAASEQVTGRLRTLGERLIAKSPIPVPDLARDALGRMQEALGQLEHVIMSGDVSTLKRAREQHKMHQKGKIDLSTVAQVAPIVGKQERSRSRASN